MLTIALLFTGCGGGKLKVSIDSDPIEGVGFGETSFLSDNGKISWTGLKITVPGNMLDYDYNPSRQSVLMKFSEEEIEGKKSKKNPHFVLFDLENESLRWSARSNATFHLYSQDLVLMSRGGAKVYDDMDGKYIGEWVGPLFLTDDMAFRLGAKVFARVDLRKGEDLWMRKGKGWVGYRSEYSRDGWLYVVAKGLHAFDVETGEGWDIKLKTYSESYAKAMAAEAALACLAAMAGGYSTGSGMQAEVYHNRYSNVLFHDDALYFADRENIYCFDSKTGEITWQTGLEKGAYKSYLALADSSIAFVRLGYKYRDYGILSDETPSVTLFDRKTGEAGPVYVLEEEGIALNFIWSPTRAVLMTSNKLYQFDHNLELITVRDSDDFLGYYQALLKNDAEQIVIRTYNGLLSVSPETFEELWKNGIGESPITTTEDLLTENLWKDALSSFRNSFNAGNVREISGLYWMYTNDGRVLGVDLGQEGKVVFEMVLETSDVLFESDCLTAKTENGMFYFPYNNLEVSRE